MPRNTTHRFLLPNFDTKSVSHFAAVAGADIDDMSVDQTISELSQTLAQLGSLVGHINNQIDGITGRLNLTLNNFDQAVANVAKDAGSVTSQVGNTVSQVPNSWVFYLLFITLIIVFILLSVVLILNLVTKLHAIYTIMRSKDGSERALIGSREDSSQFDKSLVPAVTTPYSQQSPYYPSRGHVSIAMDNEPRRPGMRRVSEQASVANSLDDTPSRPYQRRPEDLGGKYNMETGTTSSFPRSLEV